MDRQLRLPLNTRPTIEEYYLEQAWTASRRATCRYPVGAILINSPTGASFTGYNGSPKGMPHCDERGGCKLDEEGHCVYVVHAEANALLKGHGDLLVCTHSPCLECAKLIINKRTVTWVLYDKVYVDKRCEEHLGMTPVEYLEEAGVDTRRIGKK